MRLTTVLRLVPRLRKFGATPSLHPYAFKTYAGTLTVWRSHLIDLGHSSGGCGPGAVSSVGTGRLLPSVECLGSEDQLGDANCSSKLCHKTCLQPGSWGACKCVQPFACHSAILLEHSWTHNCVQWRLVWRALMCAVNTGCLLERAPKVVVLIGRGRKNYEKRLLASSFMSVRPSAWNYSAPNGWIFTKFHIWELFPTSSNKIQNLLKPCENNAYITQDLSTVFYHISLISS